MPDRPLLVLLLPGPLEALEARRAVEALLASPSVVAVEPPRVSHRALRRLPAALGAALAGMQARRMRLPGCPAAVVILGALEYPLARALLVHHPGCELWYVRAAEAEDADLHELAVTRATRVLGPGSAWADELEHLAGALAAR